MCMSNSGELNHRLPECVNVMLFLDTSKAGGGECDPSADVCSHSASTDCETGKPKCKRHVTDLFCLNGKKKSPVSAL